MTLGPGTRLGPYEVTALLGEGGMGKVWRAHHTNLGRQVAIRFCQTPCLACFFALGPAITAALMSSGAWEGLVHLVGQLRDPT